MRGIRPTLAFASYDHAALSITADALAHVQDYKSMHIIDLPLFPNEAGYQDFGSLVEDAFRATQSLLATNHEATLAMSVMREEMSEFLGCKRQRRVFSVGLVAACYTEGPLCFFSAEHWTPGDKTELFVMQAHSTLNRLQKDVTTPPAEEMHAIARLIANSLMEDLAFKLESTVTYLH